MTTETFVVRSLKALFFDMDGTLYNSMPIHAHTLTLAFEELGIEFSPIDSYLNEGSPTPEIVNNTFLKKLHRDAKDWEQEVIRKSILKYQSTITYMPKVEGMVEILDLCKLNSIDLFLVTGSPRDSRFLKNIPRDFPETFHPDRIITGDDVENGKPHPEPYLKALTLSGYHATEVAVIENAPLGITSGRDAGLHTIAINTGILDNKDLDHADVLFSDVQDLQNYLQKIFEKRK